MAVSLLIGPRSAVRTITIRAEHSAGRAVLEVEDDRPAISAELRDRLFEPFFTLRRQGRGSGLGLAVVYSIVTAHDGEVDVRSEPGEGARFIVRLPPGDIGEIDGLAGDEEPASFAAPSRRVIVVERDGKAVVAMLEELALAGYDVRHAPDAATAGRMASDWPPDAVVVRAGDGTAVAWSTGVDAPVLVVDDGSSVSTAAIVAELEAAGLLERIDDLLAEHPTLYVCTSAGNEGPGLSTVGIPATSPSLISSGAYLSPETGAGTGATPRPAEVDGAAQP